MVESAYLDLVHRVPCSLEGARPTQRRSEEHPTVLPTEPVQALSSTPVRSFLSSDKNRGSSVLDETSEIQSFFNRGPRRQHLLYRLTPPALVLRLRSAHIKDGPPGPAIALQTPRLGSVWEETISINLTLNHEFRPIQPHRADEQEFYA